MPTLQEIECVEIQKVIEFNEGSIWNKVVANVKFIYPQLLNSLATSLRESTSNNITAMIEKGYEWTVFV